MKNQEPSVPFGFGPAHYWANNPPPPLTGPLLVLQLNNHLMDLQRLIRNLDPYSVSQLEAIASTAFSMNELAGDSAQNRQLENEEAGAI